MNIFLLHIPWYKLKAMEPKSLSTIISQPGNAHLYSEGEEVSVPLTSLSLLVRNQLHRCVKQFFSISKQPILNQ